MKQRIGAVLLIALAVGVPGLLISESTGADSSETTRSGEVEVLLLMSRYYGANYNLIRDVMELYGWNITTAGVNEILPTCFYGGSLTVDTLVADIADVSQYDCLAIMTARGYTGDSHQQLLNNAEAVSLVSQAVTEGLLVVACCGGTRVLAAADVINGIHVTGREDYLQEYLDAGGIWQGDSPPQPVQDGNIITSTRNQYNSRRLCELMRTVIDSLRTVGGGS